jgi:hypothetical protein
MAQPKPLKEAFIDFAENVHPDILNKVWNRIRESYPLLLRDETGLFNEPKSHDSEISKRILGKLKREDVVKFLEWCNKPLYNIGNSIGWQLRVKALYPEYNTFYIFNKQGEVIHGRGIYLTAEQVYEYWLEHGDDKE